MEGFTDMALSSFKKEQGKKNDICDGVMIIPVY